MREFECQGLACQAEDLWFSTGAIDAAVPVVAKLLEASPEGFTVSDARLALGTSRKYAVPLLGQLDAMAVTCRQGDRESPVGPWVGVHSLEPMTLDTPGHAGTPEAHRVDRVRRVRGPWGEASLRSLLEDIAGAPEGDLLLGVAPFDERPCTGSPLTPRWYRRPAFSPAGGRPC